jgi:hypothetical protein
MEKEKIKFGIESIFHMIRHFERTNNYDIAKLKSAGYLDLQIEEEKKRHGSKFFISYATSIDDLLNKIKSEKFEVFIGDNDNVNLLFTTDNPIGTESVVDFNLLSEEEKSNLYLIENRGYILNHLNVTVLPYTNKWTMILKPKKNNTYQFITSFPGVFALPIPIPEMNKTFKQKCINFWNTHLFLVKR